MVPFQRPAFTCTRRWFEFLAVLFHALVVVSNDIVSAGGLNITGIVDIDPLATLVNLTACFMTLGVTRLLLVLMAGMHASPLGDNHGYVWGVLGCQWRVKRPAYALAKLIWASAWFVALIGIGHSDAILGIPLFGSPLWLLVVMGRAVPLLCAEGIMPPFTCMSRYHPVRNFFVEMEHVYFVTPMPGVCTNVAPASVGQHHTNHASTSSSSADTSTSSGSRNGSGEQEGTAAAAEQGKAKTKQTSASSTDPHTAAPSRSASRPTCSDPMNAPHASGSTVLGYLHMKQPLSRVLQYGMFWVVVLSVKIVFDLQILTEQQRLIATVQQATLVYAPVWNIYLFGYYHPIIVLGSWSVTFALFMLDSYIAFILAAPILGWFVLHKDGLGSVTRAGDIKSSFLGSGWWGRAPLAEQFMAKSLPIGALRKVDADSLFRRVWDQVRRT